MENAFLLLIKLDQYNTFSNEETQLQVKKSWPYSHILDTSDLYLNKNGLVCQGRIALGTYDKNADTFFVMSGF